MAEADRGAPDAAGNGPPTDLREAIRHQALGLGFDAVGFAAAELRQDAREGLAAFLARGYHGDMGWMAANVERRGEPRRLWPGARSIVALGLNYGPAENPLDTPPRTDQGVISVYARGRDYHDVFKKKLKALARWMAASLEAEVKVFVDTAPVLEKPLAQAAGIGWQGKHTNLVSREFGSWLFLGEIYCDLELAAEESGVDSCGRCRRCLDVCPTQAFPQPYQLDARRCISYLTIEHKGHIPRDLRRPMGNRIYGCDDCLAVCPWNKFATPGTEPKLAARSELEAPALAQLANLDDAAFRALFSGSPIKRIGRDRFVRNVLIALGNSGDRHSLPVVEARLRDHSALVRAMAVWALAELSTRDYFAAARAQHLPSESDAEVRAEWDEAWRSAAIETAPPDQFP